VVTVGNLGAPEIIGIIVVLVLLFGARKLPELGSSVGKSIQNFKSGMREAQEDEESSTSSESRTTDA
jgi:sec-independent protein translocase protein TatA